MKLKLAIILDKKTNLDDIDNIVKDILYPHLSTSPIKEIHFGTKYSKFQIKEIYRKYKLEEHQGFSNKKKSEDMKSKGIDTLEGFAREMYGIIRFEDNGEAVVGDNPNAFIDEYKIDTVNEIKNYDKDFLTMDLNTLIDKDLNVYKKEIQLYRRKPSTVITPVLENQNDSDILILINYHY